MNLKKLLDSGKSFTYIKNSSGPKMEPCGTPVTIGNVLDAVSFNSTNCSCLSDSSSVSYKRYFGYNSREVCLIIWYDLRYQMLWRDQGICLMECCDCLERL